MPEAKVVWILICTLISNSAYALIAPFLPLEFREKGISGEMIGLMFAIYSVAVIVCSPLVGKTVEFVGNTNMISLGIATMGLAFIFFGFVPNIETNASILTLGFFLRFVQGASSAFVQTTCYAIATNDFPEKKEQIVGWVEALTGLGLIVGPIIGSFLYSLLGYAHTFFIYGAFLVCLSFIIKLNFPGDADDESDEDDRFLGSIQMQQKQEDDLSSFQNDFTPEKVKEGYEAGSSEESPSQKVTICQLLCQARFTMAALSSALCYFTYSFMEPILAERLVDFELSSMQIGLFFALWPVFYIPASIAVQYVPRRVDKRVTIIMSAFFSGIAFIFVGPSEIFGLPNSLVLMGVGQALVGVFTAFMMIPGLPEMVESTIPLFPGQEREVNNLSSGIYNSFLGFGQVVAPAYGSFVTEAVGFRMTSDIVAFICFVFAMAYLLLAGGAEAFRKTCRSRKSPQTTDNDFINQLKATGEEDEDAVSHRSRKSSSFHMLGPTAPSVTKMRVRGAIEDISPTARYLDIQAQGEEGSPAPRPNRTKRLFSDIDGTPVGGRFSRLGSQDGGSFHMQRSGSFCSVVSNS